MASEQRDLERATLKRLLNSLAAVRQTKLDPDAEKLYVSALLGYDTQDVAEAVKQFGLEEREDYKPPYPELGALKSRIEAIRDGRKRRPRFVPCDCCAGGWLIFNEDGTPHDRVADSGKDTYAKECQCLVLWRNGQQAYVPDPIKEHLAAVQAHPERFVPVDACIQVGKALATAKLERKRAGNPMSDAEFNATRKKLTREMNEKWLEQLSADRKTMAAGA